MTKLLSLVVVPLVFHFGNSCLVKKSNATCDKLVVNSLSYLSTRSPYIYHENTWEYIPADCTAEKFWYFGRHGTRNPREREILSMQKQLPELLNNIAENYKEKRGSLCSDEISKLKSWIPYKGLNASEEKYLVEQGKKELIDIAIRYKTRFPDLFPNTFNNDSYFFKYTKSERTDTTARAFAQGLFGEGASNVWYPEAILNDPVLKFYKNCTKWVKEVKNNTETLGEQRLFDNSVYMNKTISRISRRLGFSRNLTVEELNLMYITCAFETAWEGGNKVSPWCSAFDQQDFTVMNFREDLNYYWTHSYGNGSTNITFVQACPPIKDLIETFEQFNSKRTVTGYFSHSGAILKVLTLLGLFKDENPLTTSLYETQKKKREFDTSRIDTMASNLAFALFNCPNKEKKRQIGFYFREQPTKLKACGDEWLCAFEDFKTYFAEIISSCNVNEICKM